MANWCGPMQVSHCPVWQCLEWLAIGPLYSWGLIGRHFTALEASAALHCSHSTLQHSTYPYMENVPMIIYMIFYKNARIHYCTWIFTKMQEYTILHDFPVSCKNTLLYMVLHPNAITQYFSPKSKNTLSTFHYFQKHLTSFHYFLCNDFYTCLYDISHVCTDIQ